MGYSLEFCDQCLCLVFSVKVKVKVKVNVKVIVQRLEILVKDFVQDSS